MPTADVVTTPAGSLTTVGGSTVDVTGTNLGLTPSDVVLTYEGGSDGMAQRAYSSGPCSIVAPGTHIRCSAVAGVGANYTFVVTVGGGRSAPSTQRVSYAAPVLSDVGGPGAVGCPAAGGVHILLFGVRLGTWRPECWGMSCHAVSFRVSTSSRTDVRLSFMT
jgi:hypothetical protein